MKKYLKLFIIFIMIIILRPSNVFASNTNVSSKIRYNPDNPGGTYEGDEIYLGGYNGKFSVGTRYNGRLAMVSFYISTNDYNFTTNHTYTITLNMATEDWRNHFMGPQVLEAQSNGTLGSSLNASNFRFVSYKQIKFNFKTDGSLPPYIFFRVYSTDYANPNGGSTAITGVNNWNLSSVYINNNVSATPTPRPVTPAPTPSSPTNKDIINNATQNTQDIINNNNQNTQDIIDNSTQNTTDIIENANQNANTINESLNDNCKNGKLVLTSELSDTSLSYLNTSGNLATYGGTGVTLYIKLKPNTPYRLIKLTGGSTPSDMSMCLYNVNKAFSRCIAYPTQDNFILEFTPTNYEVYARFSIYSYRVFELNGFVCNDWEREGLKNNTDAIKDVNDTLNNSNVDSGVGSDFFSDFEDNSHGLTSIITAPLTAIERLTNSTCQPLVLPIPFTNGSVSLPCMTEVYTEHIPTIYNIWKVVSFGIIAYFICIDIFHIVKGFKDPESDKVEVLDL